MQRYYFDLCDGADGADGVTDDIGIELPHDRAAVEHGYGVARELMRNSDKRCEHFCIAIHDDTGRVRLRLPFSAADLSLALLLPESRAWVERWCERRRELAQVIFDARKTLRQARALIARSRARPYLSTENGRSVA